METKDKSPFCEAKPLSCPGAMQQTMQSLHMNSETADVTFAVEGETFKAHRCILAAQSPVFAAMLYDGFKEASSDGAIELPGKKAALFGLLLKYTYTFQLDLKDLDLEAVVELLFLANEYHVKALFKALREKLMEITDIDMVFIFYEAAQILGDETLRKACRQWLCCAAGDTLKSEKFREASTAVLCDLLSLDEFEVREIEILQGLQKWSEGKRMGDIKQVLKQVRLNEVEFSGSTMAEIDKLGLFLKFCDVDLASIGCKPEGPRTRLIPGETICMEDVTVNRYSRRYWPEERLSNALIDLGKTFTVSSIGFAILPPHDAYYRNPTSFHVSIATSSTPTPSTEFTPLLKVRVSGLCMASFHIPAKTSAGDVSRYQQNCPRGGILLTCDGQLVKVADDCLNL